MKLLRKSSSRSSLNNGTSSNKKSRPSVYDESMDMLLGAMLIYLFAELRALARQRGEDAIRELEAPITGPAVIEHIRANQEALEKRKQCTELQQRLEAMMMDDASSSADSRGFWSRIMSRASKKPLVLKHFVDEKSSEQIVYAIAVNHQRKRITVIFRGSVTLKDFLQDAKCVQKRVDNPAKRFFAKRNYTTETVSVHSGFHEYLFTKDENAGKNHLDEISDKVKALLQQYPRYRVFCSGHSLGGALATLWGFYASCNDKLWKISQKKPITIYSIASPFVGGWKFRDAFLQLERIGRLQHFRIANHDDMVTHLPFFAPKTPSIIPIVTKVQGAGNLYKHVGIRLQLLADPQSDSGKIFRLSYPACLEAESGTLEQVQDSVREGNSFAKACFLLLMNKVQTYHSCELYEKRIEQCQEELSQVTLDDLYADKAIVGQVLNPDYQRAISKRTLVEEASTRSFSFLPVRMSTTSLTSTGK